MEYNFDIEEDFIEAVVDDNLPLVRSFVEVHGVNISYDNNLAIIITAEEGFNEIFDYFLFEGNINLSFNNYIVLKNAIIYENKYIIMTILNNIDIYKINNEWIEKNLNEEKDIKLLRTILNVKKF